MREDQQADANHAHAPARVYLSVGLTAHRDLVPAEEPRLRRQTRAFFKRLQGQFPDLPLRLMSALASGGDQLVAEEALALGIELMVPLPMPQDEYERDFQDAESLARDPRGRGWWVGYEQRHSVWLYDDSLSQARVAIPLHRPDWWRNRGVEALVADGDGLLALAENGREAIRVDGKGIHDAMIKAGWDIADAARAPDGSAWLLLRSKGPEGITQAIAPLIQFRTGYRIGDAWSLPKAAFDNYEGMVIQSRPGGWRFWLVTDDGHRFKARTLLVALDLERAKKNARR